MQGQLLAVRHGWHWLSMGELLRETNDPKIHEYQKLGKMVPNKTSNQIMLTKIAEIQAADQTAKFILDGYPRELEQAKALSEFGIEKLGREPIDLVLDIQMTEAEIIKRLQKRGRVDDTIASIKERLKLHSEVFKVTREYYLDLKVPVVQVNGIGLVGEVHDRIEKVLEDRQIVGEF
jgi:adenylate kinase